MPKQREARPTEIIEADSFIICISNTQNEPIQARGTINKAKDINEFKPFGSFGLISNNDPSAAVKQISNTARKPASTKIPGINQIKKLEIMLVQAFPDNKKWGLLELVAANEWIVYLTIRKGIEKFSLEIIIFFKISFFLKPCFFQNPG